MLYRQPVIGLPPPTGLPEDFYSVNGPHGKDGITEMGRGIRGVEKIEYAVFLGTCCRNTGTPGSRAIRWPRVRHHVGILTRLVVNPLTVRNPRALSPTDPFILLLSSGES